MQGAIRMCAIETRVKETNPQKRHRPLSRAAISMAGITMLAAVAISAGTIFRRPRALAQIPTQLDHGANQEILARASESSYHTRWRDSLGDGFPDSARLESAQDRENFLL